MKTPKGKGQPLHGGTKVSWIASDTPPKVPPVPPSKPPKPDISAVVNPGNSTSGSRSRKPPDIVVPPRLATSLPRGFSLSLSEELEKKVLERRATLELSEGNIS